MTLPLSRRTSLSTRPPSHHRRSRLRTDLRASCADAAAFGGMVGLGETYLVAFGLAVGLSELTAGMVGSLPLVAGGILQMISPALIRLLGSHKRWVITCATVQALVFLPLMVCAWQGSISGWGLLLIASIYWGAGLATGPAWNTWIGTLVPGPIRPKYFAMRTRASQATVFVGFLAGGLFLQWADAESRVMAAYAALFGVACVCRLISVAMLALHSEPMPIPPNMRSIPPSQWLGLLRGQSSGRLLLYLVAVQAAAQMSGPYFTPYMFQKLNFSYGQFVGLISVAFLAKVLALPAWGRIAHRIGPGQLLWIGGIGIAPLSAGWMLSESLAWLMVLQVAAGVMWAAYELAFFLLFFDSIKVEERTSLLTLYNLVNTIAWVIGAMMGGLLLHGMGASHSAYLAIFGISSVCRVMALLLLARVPSMESHTEDIGLRTLSVRPNGASLDAPVMASLPEEEQAAPEEEASEADDKRRATLAI